MYDCHLQHDELKSFKKEKHDSTVREPTEIVLPLSENRNGKSQIRLVLTRIIA